MQKLLTSQNGLELYVLLCAIANVVKLVAPADSIAVKIADKVLALSIDVHKLLGNP